MGRGLALATAATAGALGYVYLRWCERGATPPVLSTSGTLTFQVTMPMRTFLVVFTNEHTSGCHSHAARTRADVAAIGLDDLFSEQMALRLGC